MKKFLQTAVSAALFVCASASTAQTEHEKHCLYGCPLGAHPDNTLIVRGAYTLSSNSVTKLADWVAYRITPKTIGVNVKRSGYASDPDLAPDETLERNDYDNAFKKMRIERGHQAPFKGLSGLSNPHMLNYLSNITPQKRTLNNGAWKSLEYAVRKLAEKTGKVFVMTGPLYKHSMPQLPNADEPHKIPSGYWKIISVRGKGGVNWAAFVLQQDTPAAVRYCRYASTIRTIERMTGLNFFHAAPAGEENRLETSAPGLRAGLNCGD